MLDPQYLEHLPDSVTELYSAVEQDIIADMARRICTYDYWIPAADWQYQKLIAMGNLQRDIRKALAAQSGKTEKELEALMQQAGRETLRADTAIYEGQGLSVPPIAESEILQQILNEGLRATKGEFRNLTRTTAAAASAQFSDALDRAWLQIQSGAFDTNTAVRQAIQTISKSGLQAVRYPSGRTDSIETAARRAIVTGVNQTACRLQLSLAQEMGSDLVEVTAHAGARPSHAVWQGQVFSLSGKSKQYKPFVQSTGYGTGAGLGGWNCRHSFFPYFEGSPSAYTKDDLKAYASKQYTYNGKAMTEYEATQQQRYIERQIRRWKRENAAMKAAGQDTIESAAKFKKWNTMYQDFLQQTGLKRQDGRLVISIGTGIAKPEQSGILKESEEQAIKKYISAYSYQINDALRSGEVLTAEQAAFVKELDSALNKMPVYQGTVYRSVSSEGISDINAFIAQYLVYSTPIFPAYTSASVGMVYDDTMPIQYIITSKTGVDIRKYNEKEGEIIFRRDTMFVVKKVEGNIIYMEEM